VPAAEKISKARAVRIENPEGRENGKIGAVVIPRLSLAQRKTAISQIVDSDC
jgi:hypothetical protein